MLHFKLSSISDIYSMYLMLPVVFYALILLHSGTPFFTSFHINKHQLIPQKS